MPRTEFISTGMYVPERVVTNDELTQWMDTSDEWIRTRSGIRDCWGQIPSTTQHACLRLLPHRLADGHRQRIGDELVGDLPGDAALAT